MEEEETVAFDKNFMVTGFSVLEATQQLTDFKDPKNNKTYSVLKAKFQIKRDWTI